MKQSIVFLEKLILQGVKIWSNNQQLHYNDPHSILTPKCLKGLKQHKPYLLDYLSDKHYQSTQIQQYAWYAYQAADDKVVYQRTFTAKIYGTLDQNAFNYAWQALMQRYSTLRTTYHEITHQTKSVLTSVVKGVQQLEISKTDAQTWNAEVLQTQITAHQTRPFDLINGPLLHVNLFTLNVQEHFLLVNVPHVTLDAVSLKRLMDDLVQLYLGVLDEKSIPPFPLSTPEDYALWEIEKLKQDTIGGADKQKDNDKTARLDLPTDYPRHHQNGEFIHQMLRLTESDRHQLQNLLTSTKTTFEALTLSLLKVLLYRYTGKAILPIGIKTRSLNYTNFDDLVGNFTHTILLQSSILNEEQVTTFINSLHQSHMELNAIHNIGYPIEDISSPQVVLVLKEASTQGNKQRQWGALSFKPLVEECSLNTSVTELKIEIIEEDQNLMLAFSCRLDLFTNKTFTRIIGHFKSLLKEVLNNPACSISKIQWLTNTEQQQLLVNKKDEPKPPFNKSVYQLFEEQVERSPEAIAILADAVQISYYQLNKRANQLAHYLLTLNIWNLEGRNTEPLVGICVERSIDMIIGMLGILKAGGAYVPIDPSYPQKRIAFMLQDAKTAVLLTQKHLQTDLSLNSSNTNIICLDSNWSDVAMHKTSNLNKAYYPDRLAYVLYTSGSTGKPKGVMIEQHGLTALISWAQTVYNKEELAGVLASTSICFDLSIFEIFLPLSVGGKIILVENSLHLSKTEYKNQVTLINTVPSSIEVLLQQDAIPSSVQTINLAGELLQQSIVEKLYQLPTVQKVYDLYGPSEDTTYSTFVRRIPNGKATIGRPIDYTKAYILDTNLQLLPINVAGELYLSGAGLARGYLNMPELTQQKFIDNPFSENKVFKRLYKTGDLVRWLLDPQGELTIEYLGRIDHQVKVRGFRIELGEVETVIEQYNNIKEVVVVAHKANNKDEKSGLQQLIAYIVNNKNQFFSQKILRDYLNKKLPHYMIPSAFILLEALPRTPNGKVDRKALPSPELIERIPEDTRVSPRNQIEMIIATVWTDTLNIQHVGIHDNFMDLGGYSLQVIQVASKLNTIFQVQVPISRVMETSTVAKLADLLIEYEKKAGQIAKLARLQQRLTQFTE